MRLYKIDEIKFICAVLVVMIHVTSYLPQQSLNTFINYDIYRPLLNIAVPFFFTVSGIFMAFKYKNSEGFTGIMQKYSIKILTMYLSFTIFYLCFRYLLIISDRVILKTSFHETSKYFFEGLNMKYFVNGSIGSYHLWFLTSLLIASLFIILFTHFKCSPSLIFIISIIQYIAYSSGIFTLNNVFDFGGVPLAFLYVSLGFYIGYKQNFEISKPLIGFFVSILFYWILNKTGISEFPLLLSIYYLTVYAMQNPGRPTKLANLGQHSLNIYILHIFIQQIIDKVLIYFGTEKYYELWMYYPITIILCVVLSIYSFPIINRVFYKPAEKWIFKF